MNCEYTDKVYSFTMGDKLQNLGNNNFKVLVTNLRANGVMLDTDHAWIVAKGEAIQHMISVCFGCKNCSIVGRLSDMTFTDWDNILIKEDCILVKLWKDLTKYKAAYIIDNVEYEVHLH